MIRDIWEEKDEQGTVRMAMIQTVSVCALISESS